MSFGITIVLLPETSNCYKKHKDILQDQDEIKREALKAMLLKTHKEANCHIFP